MGLTGKPPRKPGDSQPDPEASGAISARNRDVRVGLGKRQEQPLARCFCTLLPARIQWGSVKSRGFFKRGSRKPQLGARCRQRSGGRQRS